MFNGRNSIIGKVNSRLYSDEFCIITDIDKNLPWGLPVGLWCSNIRGSIQDKWCGGRAL